MKRIFFALGLVLCILISSCSNPGGGVAVTANDRDQAVQAMSAANSAALGQAASASGNPSLVTYTGPYFSLNATFVPDLAGFMSASTSSATVTETITGFHDGSTGYTISGTLVCTIHCTLSSMDTMSISGNFTLSGGNVRTMSLSLSFDLYGSPSGSVTVNGQTFLL